MTKATIMYADNNEDFRRTRVVFLEREGYEVLQASNPTDARRMLEKDNIDLAILDLRLRDDDDPKDISGLMIAKEVSPSVPKIILTQFPTVEVVRESLRQRLEGSPVAVDLVDANKGTEELLASIRLAITLQVEKRVKQTAIGLSEELERYFGEVRKQAAVTHRIGLALLVGGCILLLVWAITTVIWEQTTLSILSGGSGVFVEALAIIFLSLSGRANKRMDKCRKELLEFNREVQGLAG